MGTLPHLSTKYKFEVSCFWEMDIIDCVRKSSPTAGLCASGRPVRYLPSAGLLEFMRQVERPGLVNLAAGVPSPDLLPVADLKRAFRTATEEDGRTMWAYQRPEGHAVLRGRIAARLKRRGVKVQAADVILTNGCTQALHLAISVLAGPGAVVACESPGYYNMLEQIYSTGSRALPLPVDFNRGIHLEEAERLLRRHRPKCLVVCTTLSNPTGATMPQDRRRRLAVLCRELGIVLIEDDIYGELCDAGAPRPLRALDDGNNVIYVSSFCKSVSPGLRVGYIVPGKWYDPVVRRKCNSDLHCSVVSESILSAFLGSGAFEKHLDVLRKKCARRRETVREAVLEYFPKGTLVSEPQGGFLLWAELPFKLDSLKWSERAVAAGVSFARGDVFLTAPPRRTCLRLNCARATEGDLEPGIRKLADLI